MTKRIICIIYLCVAHFIINQFNTGYPINTKRTRIQRNLLEKVPPTKLRVHTHAIAFPQGYGHKCSKRTGGCSSKELECQSGMYGLTMDDLMSRDIGPWMCTYKDVQPAQPCTLHKECWHNNIIGDDGPGKNITYLCQKQSKDRANEYGTCEPSKWGEECNTNDDCPYFMNGEGGPDKLQCLPPGGITGMMSAFKICRFPDRSVPDKWQCAFDAECKNTKQVGTGYLTLGTCAKLTRGTIVDFLSGQYSDYGRCNAEKSIQYSADRWEFSRVKRIIHQLGYNDAGEAIDHVTSKLSGYMSGLFGGTDKATNKNV